MVHGSTGWAPSGRLGRSRQSDTGLRSRPFRLLPPCSDTHDPTDVGVVIGQVDEIEAISPDLMNGHAEGGRLDCGRWCVGGLSPQRGRGRLSVATAPCEHYVPTLWPEG